MEMTTLGKALAPVPASDYDAGTERVLHPSCWSFLITLCHSCYCAGAPSETELAL